jgi:hypothetical protein
MSSLHATCFTLVSCLAYSSTLNMEATCSSETSGDFQQPTWRYIPEDTAVHNHRCENLKSYIMVNLMTQRSEREVCKARLVQLVLKMESLSLILTSCSGVTSLLTVLSQRILHPQIYLFRILWLKEKNLYEFVEHKKPLNVNTELKDYCIFSRTSSSRY